MDGRCERWHIGSLDESMPNSATVRAIKSLLTADMVVAHVHSASLDAHLAAYRAQKFSFECNQEHLNTKCGGVETER